MIAVFIIGWVVISVMLITWGILSIKDGDATVGSIIGLIIGIALAILFFVMLFSGINSYTPTEEEITQAQENYKEAYENTAILENYSIETEISLKKGWLGLGITIGGDVTKSGDIYSGNVDFEMPGEKYECTYSAPHGESGNWSKLYVDGVEGNNCMNLPFNAADFNSGIICQLSDEMIASGVPSDASLSNISFSLTDEQIKDLYGVIFDFFKTMAGSDLDLSNLEFSSSKISVSIQNNKIKSFTVNLSGKANAGSISCEFKCMLK